MTALPPEFRSYTLAGAGLTMTLARPAPLGPHDVRVAIKAASLNYRDLLIAKDQIGPAAKNIIPLSDGAGEIVEVGAAVTAWKVGERVMPSFFQTWQDGSFSQGYFAGALGGAVDGVLTGYGATPNLNGLFSANATINGIMVGPRVFLERAAAFIARYDIAPVIDRTFAFDQAADAYRYLAAAGHMGKIVITA